MREVDSPDPLTLAEAQELIEHHARRASDMARSGNLDAARAHGTAASALKDAVLLGGLRQRDG